MSQTRFDVQTLVDSPSPEERSIALRNVVREAACARGWLPRGTLDAAATSLLQGHEEDAILRLLRQELSEDDLASVLDVLGQFGGQVSAEQLRVLVCDQSQWTLAPDRITSHRLQALELIGGPDAVTSFIFTTIIGDERWAHIADWRLRELATGGSEDETGGVLVVSEDFTDHVFRLVNWGEVLPRLMIEKHPEGYERMLAYLRRSTKLDDDRWLEHTQLAAAKHWYSVVKQTDPRHPSIGEPTTDGPKSIESAGRGTYPSAIVQQRSMEFLNRATGSLRKRLMPTAN